MANNEALVEWLGRMVEKHGFSETAEAAPASNGDVDLDAEYEKLGGDKELLKVLGLEDDLWRNEIGKVRMEAREWQQTRLTDIEDDEHHMQRKLAEHERDAPKVRAWLESEQPNHDELVAELEALGSKADTEAGKQLQFQLERKRGYLDSMRKEIADDGSWAEKAAPALAEFAEQRELVERTYEVVEQRLRGARTEMNNALELRVMSLEEKVARLRAGGAKAKEKEVEAVREEIYAIFEKGNKRDRERHDMFFEEPGEYPPTPIDWAPMKKLLAKLRSSSLEDLQKKGSKEAKLERLYEKAGGDEKLFELRMKNWSERQETTRNLRSIRMHGQTYDEQRLQDRVNEAQLGLDAARRSVQQALARQSELKTRMEKLVAGTETGELLSETEAAEVKLMQRELERLETDVENGRKLMAAQRDLLENAEDLLEKQREVYEEEIDDDHEFIEPMPKEEDIWKLPLAEKYRELKAG